jgi:hypothetical protein
MTVIEVVAKRIQGLLAEKQLSQCAATVNLSTLYNNFNGRQKVISFNILLLPCNGLGITIQEFLDDRLFAPNNLDID